MSRSTSTFSLNDSIKTSAMVQRSNSLDLPPVRARVPVCVRTPCTPAQNPAHSPSRFSQCVDVSNCPGIQKSKPIPPSSLLTSAAQPLTQQSTSLTQPTSTSKPAVPSTTQLHSKKLQPISSLQVSRPLPSLGSQPRSPQPVNVKGRTSESHRDPQVPLDPRKAVLTSPRRETLL